ncbi:MAG: riboflavin synthase [Candidatus Brocadiales bacterium]|nr:riboflavin synthase [Candidatus Bathyanammoxibius amoris]
MFTGIIENMGVVKELARVGQGGRLRIELSGLAGELGNGDSLSVDGVCLTVVDIAGGVAGFDVSHETLKRSTLGGLRPGDRVNLETALAVGDRLGGHFVQGHVDGTGTVEKIESRPGECTIWFSAGTELTQYMIEKGSVAVDGISLTVVDLTPQKFSIAIIPFTLENTTLGLKKAGDRVNIEADMLGKWIKKLQSPWGAPQGEAQGEGLTIETLKARGFE